MGSDLSAQVRGAVAASVAGAGADLEAVELVRAGSRTVVRIVVDTDAGVSLDEVADINRAVGDALDASGVMGERRYVLEVSSPGVSRPLVLPRHWRRNTGRLVRVQLRGEADAVEGRIGDVGDDTAEVHTESGPRRLRFDDITRAVVQVEFRAEQGG